MIGKNGENKSKTAFTEMLFLWIHRRPRRQMSISFYEGRKREVSRLSILALTRSCLEMVPCSLVLALITWLDLSLVLLAMG